jgi:hypothetical protein
MLDFLGANIVNLVAALTAVIAAIFAIRKLIQWLRPIRVNPGIKVGIDGNFFKATITNKSSESQYVIKCDAKGTYTFRHIVMTHIRRPFISPRLYQNVRYGGVIYDLLNQESLKLEPSQPIELSHKLCDHPLSAVHTPFFIVEEKV